MTWISFILPIRCVFSRVGNGASVSGKLSGGSVSQVKGRIICKLWQQIFGKYQGGQILLSEKGFYELKLIGGKGKMIWVISRHINID